MKLSKQVQADVPITFTFRATYRAYCWVRNHCNSGRLLKDLLHVCGLDYMSGKHNFKINQTCQFCSTVHQLDTAVLNATLMASSFTTGYCHQLIIHLQLLIPMVSSLLSLLQENGTSWRLSTKSPFWLERS